MYPVPGRLLALPPWLMYLELIITSLGPRSIHRMLAALRTFSYNISAWISYLVMVVSAFVPGIIAAIKLGIIIQVLWMLGSALLLMFRPTRSVVSGMPRWIFRPAIASIEATIWILERAFWLGDRQSGTVNGMSSFSQLVLAFRALLPCRDGDACMNTVAPCRSGRCRQEAEKLELSVHQTPRQASRNKKEYRRRMSALKKKQFATRSQRLSLNPRLASLHSENTTLLSSNESLRSENRTLRARVITLELQEAQSFVNQVILHSRVAKINSANEELRKASQEDAQALQLERDCLRLAYSKMHSDNKTLHSRVSILELQEADLVVDQVLLRSRVANLTSESKTLRSKITTLESQEADLVVNQVVLRSRVANLDSANKKLRDERNAPREIAQAPRTEFDTLCSGHNTPQSERDDLEAGLKQCEAATGASLAAQPQNLGANPRGSQEDEMKHQDTSVQPNCLEDNRFSASDTRLKVPALEDAPRAVDASQWDHELLGELNAQVYQSSPPRPRRLLSERSPRDGLQSSSYLPTLVRDTTPDPMPSAGISPDIATPESQERSLVYFFHGINVYTGELEGPEMVHTPLRPRGGQFLWKRGQPA
ncbi:hypothetical protein OBBRIDRAFT_808348 [Obba rivulosa]|uniref:Uncharacterized protein n=1 Tax=Obba rivulosa TaxID=1052685 RepID=A0A8E2AHJ3_9APHY|nr:hypothetical protein OBBRIDRAFT_808348 [Obba rivulosa]